MSDSPAGQIAAAKIPPADASVASVMVSLGSFKSTKPAHGSTGSDPERLHVNAPGLV